MAAAVAAANEQMGIAADGSLPVQADRLLSIMGLPRAASAVPASVPAAPPPTQGGRPPMQVMGRRGPPQSTPPPPGAPSPRGVLRR